MRKSTVVLGMLAGLTIAAEAMPGGAAIGLLGGLLIVSAAAESNFKYTGTGNTCNGKPCGNGVVEAEIKHGQPFAFRNEHINIQIGTPPAKQKMKGKRKGKKKKTVTASPA